MAISTFMGLETNKRGLTAQQTSLYTVGNNISNANTVGYTRQRVNLVSTTGFPSAGMNAPMMAGHLGTGVTSESITRVRNQFTDVQYRQETNNLGYWSQRTDAISQMEDIMAEPSEYGLNAAFDDFYTAWQTLANDPNSSSARQVVYTKASHLASSFNYMNKQIEQIQSNFKSETLNTVDKINSILDRITSLNNQIKTVEPNGYLPNELYDARDVLLDELSEYIPITTQRLYSGGLATDDAEGALQVYMVMADGTRQPLVTSEPSGGTQLYNGKERTLYGVSVATKLSLTSSNIDTTTGTITERIPILSGDQMTDSYEPISGLTFSKQYTEILKVKTDTDESSGAKTIAYNNGSVDLATVTMPAGGGTPTVTVNEGVATYNADGTIGIAITVDGVTTNKLISPTLDEKGDIIGATVTTIETPKNYDVSSMQSNKGQLLSYFNLYGTTDNKSTSIIPLKYETDASGNYLYDANGVRQTTPESTTFELNVSGYFKDKLKNLDELANKFANEFNSIHALGYGLAKDATSDSPTNLDFFNVNGADPLEKDNIITAANIKINDLMKDFNNVAASDRNQEEGNGNLALKLSNLKTTAIASLGNTSASKFYESMLADVGTEGQKAVQMAYNSGTLQLSIANRRSSETSVSLDEEMTDMIKFQQAYNASARMMTTIDETLEKIINGMGRVGL